jgi:hypothetical protein
MSMLRAGGPLAFSDSNCPFGSSRESPLIMCCGHDVYVNGSYQEVAASALGVHPEISRLNANCWNRTSSSRIQVFCTEARSEKAIANFIAKKTLFTLWQCR